MMIVTTQFSFSIFIILAYYHYSKIILRRPAYYLARLFKLTKKYSIEEARGAIGFLLVVLTHILFAFFLYFALNIKFQLLGFNIPSLNTIILGIFLGAGLAGTSMIICLFFVKLFSLFTRFTEEEIMIALPGGWLKSYEHVKIVTPAFISIPVIVLQLACEEVIFRGMFIHFFINLGAFYSLIISALLFAFMQIFLIPTLRGALFPVIGALLMGFVHGYLFLIMGSIWPLIVSHTVFFMIFTA